MLESELEFIRGNPNEKKGKAIFYIRESLSGNLYALFASKDELELRRIFEDSVSEEIIKEVCGRKEEIVDDLYYHTYPVSISEEQLKSYKDFDLVFCGEMSVQNIDEVSSTLTKACNLYRNGYIIQKRKDHLTVGEFFEIKREITYEDSYKNYNSEDLRKRLHSHMACLLDSINFDRKEDLEDRLFKIKVFFKGFPCQDVVSRILDVSQQKIKQKKKNKILSLLSEEIIAVNDEDYEKAKEVRNRLKKFKVKYSKTI